MIRRELNLQGRDRLQSRQAAEVVQEACKYTSRILIEQGAKTVNAKSMMGVLSLGVQPEKLVLVVDGDDEQKALAAIEPMIGDMFSAS